MEQTERFFTVVNRVFDCGLKPRDIAVFCCICRHINHGTGQAFPSRRIIARECGIRKVETVDEAITVLCEKGLLNKVPQREKDGGFMSNVYTVPPFSGPGSTANRDTNKTM